MCAESGYRKGVLEVVCLIIDHEYFGCVRGITAEQVLDNCNITLNEPCITIDTVFFNRDIHTRFCYQDNRTRVDFVQAEARRHDRADHHPLSLHSHQLASSSSPPPPLLSNSRVIRFAADIEVHCASK